jgi:hypothetical protein
MDDANGLRLLTDEELDLVDGAYNWNPGGGSGWTHNPPPVNPGGPILITCIVGKGCMERPG